MLALFGAGFWLFIYLGYAKHLEVGINRLSRAFFCALSYVINGITECLKSRK